jgi:hypothetical protein
MQGGKVFCTQCGTQLGAEVRTLKHEGKVYIFCRRPKAILAPDCINTWLTKKSREAINRVAHNPPYIVKGSNHAP